MSDNMSKGDHASRYLHKQRRRKDGSIQKQFRRKGGIMEKQHRSTDESKHDPQLAEEEDPENRREIRALLHHGFNKKFSQILTCLKNKDRRIYDKEYSFFSPEEKEEKVTTTEDCDSPLNESPDEPALIKDVDSKNDLDSADKYLSDYFINRRYVDKPSSSRSEPTQDISDTEDEFEDEQEVFEYKYNFRYEEPDPQYARRYPRTMSAQKEDSQ